MHRYRIEPQSQIRSSDQWAFSFQGKKLMRSNTRTRVILINMHGYSSLTIQLSNIVHLLSLILSLDSSNLLLLLRIHHHLRARNKTNYSNNRIVISFLHKMASRIQTESMECFLMRNFRINKYFDNMYCFCNTLNSRIIIIIIIDADYKLVSSKLDAIHDSIRIDFESQKPEWSYSCTSIRNVWNECS